LVLRVKSKFTIIILHRKASLAFVDLCPNIASKPSLVEETLNTRTINKVFS